LIPTIRESTQFKVFLGINVRFPDLCGGEFKQTEEPRQNFKIIGEMIKQRGILSNQL